MLSMRPDQHHVSLCLFAAVAVVVFASCRVKFQRNDLIFTLRPFELRTVLSPLHPAKHQEIPRENKNTTIYMIYNDNN